MVRFKIEIHRYLWKERFFRTHPEKLTKFLGKTPMIESLSIIKLQDSVKLRFTKYPVIFLCHFRNCCKTLQIGCFRSLCSRSSFAGLLKQHFQGLSFAKYVSLNNVHKMFTWYSRPLMKVLGTYNLAGLSTDMLFQHLKTNQSAKKQ